jgi:hypothetical protein
LIAELILVFVAGVVIFADLIYGILVEELCVKLEKVVIGGLIVSSISKLGVEKAFLIFFIFDNSS